MKGVDGECPRFAGSSVLLLQCMYVSICHPISMQHIGEHEASLSIETLALIEGYLPRRALALVLEWASEHRKELLANWDLMRKGLPPNKISPLE